MSSAKNTEGAYADTTDVHLTLDLLGNPTAIAARYEGTSARVSQLATTDVFDLLGRSLRHVRRDAQTFNPSTEQAEGGTTSPDATMQTTYRYDPNTFRLLRSRTTRLTDTTTLQDLRFVHDAVGNVTCLIPPGSVRERGASPRHHHGAMLGSCWEDVVDVELLAREATKLSLPDQQLLLEHLVDALASAAERDVAQAWDEEISSRIEGLDSGEVTTVPWSEVRRRLHDQRASR